MAETTKSFSPPYATFGTFTGFLNKLRETGVPGRIDPTVFGNASGSISYSILASLKFLKLTDENGTPAPEFIELVNASDEGRAPLLKKIIERGYGPLFQPNVKLATMTPGQFDELMRNEYGVQGSTIDKVASFFIAATKSAGIPLSTHLLARKPIASSPSAKKSVKQRRSSEPRETDSNDAPPPPPPPASQGKALEYQLIDLMSEPDIDAEVKTSIWSLVQYLTARKSKKPAESSE